MKQIYFNDNKPIAEALITMDTHICQMAAIAHQKVTSLRLTYLHEAYKASRGELFDLVRRTLLNYVSPDYILKKEKFLHTTHYN